MVQKGPNICISLSIDVNKKVRAGYRKKENSLKWYTFSTIKLYAVGRNFQRGVR